ncbi:CerR family C-terminal domain-containing protein [Tropicimonas sediminicola]|uniref:Transcriptional regulator, TetR family n=1 Tax=Tropicimonas sediminicola TaxID=1031541 RepID=A0A239EP40_9RHOB|nr:CerR family C-terminal domain-containing protein [Tropicimonas sediminicola]SNS46415.1 transcriptional regulator, TetR family [Tropicimonas sediminicola]
MPQSPEDSTSPSEQTRKALLDAAITLFGREGFRGTSTRAIAQAAETNVASIAYHFGSKEGLRIACGAAIAERIAEVVGRAGVPEVETPEQALKVFEAVIAAFVHFLLLEQGRSDFVAFMMRELAEDGPAVEEVYRAAIEPRHRAFCRMWEVATGWPAESERTRLTVFSLIGQVLYFRIGQNVVQRRMDWDGMDEARVRQITEVLVANLRASFAANRRPGS